LLARSVWVWNIIHRQQQRKRPNTMMPLWIVSRSAAVLSLSLVGDILLFQEKVSAFSSVGSSPSRYGGRRTIETGTDKATSSLLLSPHDHRHDDDDAFSYLVLGQDHGRLVNERRSVLMKLGSSSLLSVLLVLPTSAKADDNDDGSKTDNEDLTASLYNPDGSLKANVASEATFRTVSFRLSAAAPGEDPQQQVGAIDGKPNAVSSSSSSSSSIGGVVDENNPAKVVMVSYQLPDTWATDRYETNGQSTCRRITVYRAIMARPTDLAMATKIGVTKVLETARIGLDDKKADLMSGAVRDGYYDFDLGPYYVAQNARHACSRSPLWVPDARS
jgi:hypothetical protein